MLLRLVVILLCCLLTHLLQATPDTIRVTRINDLIEIGDKVEYFVDSSKRLSLRTIWKKYDEGAFHAVVDEAPNFTGQTGVIWFRFVLNSQVADDVALSFPNVFIETLSIFVCRADSVCQQRLTGFGHPWSQRDFATSDYIIPMPDKPGLWVIYGSIANSAKPPMMMTIKVGTVRAVLAEHRASEFISIGVLGALLVMLFYNLCLALLIGDRLYFYYCFYITTALLVIISPNGYLFEWVWPNNPELNTYPWWMGVFLFGQLTFANKFLRVKEFFPLAFRFSFVIYAGSLLLIAYPFFPIGSLNPLLVANCMLLPVYFLVVSVWLCIHKIQVAYVFLLGWLPILTVTILNALMMLDLIRYSIFLDLHAVELSLTWELAVFSLALGNRYNLMRSEKLDAQAAHYKIINEQKVTLRKLVIEQTEEMLSQNDQLLRNQEEIKLQNERLETQNKAYERLKEMILRQNHDLETSVQRRTLQLAQSNEELKKYVHQLEQFSFIAAHNLRAPVARILGLVNILDYSNPNNRENASILKKIVVSARDLDVIIHDLGAILDAQKNRIDKTECVDVSRLIEKIIHRHKPDIESAGILIETSLSAPCIVAVPAYLDSILSNLISNSIKYRADHRKAIILVVTEESPTNATIIVHDNGIGFDSKLFNHKLFEPFQRFHTHKDGKGLGMFLVKTHVIAMNGTIALTSEPDIGTHIIITLPKLERQNMSQ